MDLKNELKNNGLIKDIDNNKKNVDEIYQEKKNQTNKTENYGLSENPNDAVVFIHKPLCADYHSESDLEKHSSDSEYSISSNSTISDSEDSTDISNSEEEKRFCKKKDSTEDVPFSELPPIEDLKISVPEKDCMEIGIITNIVDILVIVEAYKGTPALDVDTILFLDLGKKTLGKIFEVLGPIAQPIYSIRFNSKEQILKNMIKKELIVYYAPKSEHTTFVFLSEILKIKGSDASWKDNMEAPPEVQDFSDDEVEKHFKTKNVKQERSTLSYKPLNSKKKPLYNFIWQQNYRKMRDNRFWNSSRLNECFKNSITSSPINQNMKWINEKNPLVSMSSYNFKNSFSSNCTPPCNNSNTNASSSFVYSFPKQATSFSEKSHLHYFQKHK